MRAEDRSIIHFVTGGSGYLGRNILRELAVRGHAARALVRSAASADVVRGLGAEPVTGDMMAPDSFRDAMQGCDRLLHLAADTRHGGYSAEQLETNLKGTRNVFAAARQAGIARGLQMSSEAVLLTGKPLINAQETRPYPRKFPGAYSQSKAMAEQIALGTNAPGFDVVALRPRFVWGRDDTTALPQLVDAARSGKLAWIDGGHYLTSTTHVANVVHGALLALEGGRGGEAYFVTDGEPLPFREFVTRLLATQGVEPPSREVPRWLVAPVVRISEALSRLTGGRVRGPMTWQEYATLGVEVTLDISRARNELGYAPVISVDEGMAELAQIAAPG